MLQTQAAALPKHQEEEETDKTKQAQIKQTYCKQAVGPMHSEYNNNRQYITKSNTSPKKLKSEIFTNRTRTPVNI